MTESTTSTSGAATPTGVHMVGSATFETPRECFARVGAALGDRIERIPDGEPGPRSDWVFWQRDFFAENPALTLAHQTYLGGPAFTFAPGHGPEDLVFENLGYADEAIASFEQFDAAVEAGEVPPATRFQVSLPSPLGTLAGGVVALADAGAMEPAYEQALLREVARIVAGIPNSRLSIQWDLCLETLLWDQQVSDFKNEASRILYEESLRNDFWGGQEGMVERAARLVDAVPEGVEQGFHFCYGDHEGAHEYEPKDLRDIVELTSGVLGAVHRPISYIHLPVPIDRDDPAFFAPLADLDPRGAKIFLGLLHERDGADGAARRVAAAQRYVTGFGLATECGWGRRPPEGMDPLMELHAVTTEPVTHAR